MYGHFDKEETEFFEIPQITFIFFVYVWVGLRYVTNLKSLTIWKRNILCDRKMQQKNYFLSESEEIFYFCNA